jgi:hypothetical protein
MYNVFCLTHEAPTVLAKTAPGAVVRLTRWNGSSFSGKGNVAQEKRVILPLLKYILFLLNTL